MPFPPRSSLFDRAVRAVADMDEPSHLNPIREKVEDDKAKFIDDRA